MGVPQVAIVGRANVGKSSLLNWLAGRRISVVDNRPGVTRDRIVYLMEHEERFFELVDTGGMGRIDEDNLTADIENQITQAIDMASLILLVVDARQGVAPLDQEVAKRLRYLDTPVLCVANKADDDTFDPVAEEFFRLGHGRPLKVSTLQNRNRSVLLNRLVSLLPPALVADETAAGAEPEMKVAIVGRRNVGKSTFVNTLVQAERVIVSEIPGTTRDSVDVRFELDGKSFVAIDTPGIRRAQSRDDLDFYGTHRAQRSIRRADVALLFLDSGERVSKIDKQLADYISQEYKPCIFVVNKWDLHAGTMPTEKWVNYLNDTFRTMRYAPIAFVTGQTGKNVKALLNHSQMLFKQSRSRVGTGQLNRMVRRAVLENPPPLHQNRRPRIFYATQVGVQPPTVVVFCNQPSAITPQYQRYLLGRFRDELPYSETPIKLYLRRREDSDPRDEIDSKISAEAE